MNDIEVLEDYLKSLEFMGDTMIKSSEIIKLIEYKEIKAIERLINRIKDLEEINEAHKKENGELRKEIEKKNNMYLKEYNEHIEKKRENGVLINNELILKRELENSIPKSLIKEKIKELEFAIAFCGNEDRMKRLILQKEVLEELLKGE